MKNRPLVSIIIACFNSAQYLKQAIDSVLNQSYRNIELILVDDCSTDNTVALIREYLAMDNRVRLVQRSQRGGRPAITKNTGIEHIKGEFLCFLDHDDYYHPNKIESLVSLLLENTACVAAFHDIELVNSEGQFLNRYLDNFTEEAKEHLVSVGDSKYVCNKNFFTFQSIKYAAIHTISVMISIERFGRENLYFDTRYKVCDDTELWIRLGLSGEIAYINNILAYYRQHESNITRDLIKVQEDSLLLMTNNFQRIENIMTDDDKCKLKARISHYYSDLGWMYRKKRIPGKSLPAYLKAWKWSGNRKHLVHAMKSLFPVRNA